MRVLHVYRTYVSDSQGGLEETIRQICHNTARCGIESSVFTLSRNPTPHVLWRQEAKVYRFHRTFEIASCGISLSGVSGFKRLTERVDVVHYHFPWPFGDFLHVVGRVTKPAVVTYHSDIVRQRALKMMYNPLMRHFLESVNSIVATSPNYFATSDVLSRYSEKVEVIPIGLDKGTHPQVTERELASVRAQVGEGFFLFVGMLRYYKGLHILLDAIRGTSLRVVVAGAGPIERELKAHARSLGLSNVHFLGSVSDQDKMALIQLARAIVFPSYLRSEAFGVTLLEGAMYGKPLISTEIGTGTSYVNVDGETGFVVPPANPAQLREAMLKLNANPALARRMGKAAHERYERLFTGRQMGNRYAELYRRLAGGQAVPFASIPMAANSEIDMPSSQISSAKDILDRRI